MTPRNKLEQILFCSTPLLCWPLPKSPFPQGFLTTQQMAVCDAKWQLFLLTPGILTPKAVCSVSCSVTFHILKMEMDSGGESTQRSVPHLCPPPGKECQGNDMATTVSLIPMKITGWQGGCHPRLLHPSTTDNYRSSRLAAMLLLSVEIASCCLRAQESDFN